MSPKSNFQSLHSSQLSRSMTLRDMPCTNSILSSPDRLLRDSSSNSLKIQKRNISQLHILNKMKMIQLSTSPLRKLLSLLSSHQWRNMTLQNMHYTMSIPSWPDMSPEDTWNNSLKMNPSINLRRKHL